MLLARWFLSPIERFPFRRIENHAILSFWGGGWHGRERCSFQGFQEAGPRLRTDNGGNRVSPARSPLAAADLHLAGLRSFSEFPGVEGFSSVLGKITLSPPIPGHPPPSQPHSPCP